MAAGFEGTIWGDHPIQYHFPISESKTYTRRVVRFDIGHLGERPQEGVAVAILRRDPKGIHSRDCMIAVVMTGVHGFGNMITRSWVAWLILI